MRIRQLLSLAVLLLALGSNGAMAARFSDPFTSDPSAVDHGPFMWNMPALAPEGRAGWRLQDGALEYRADQALPCPREARAYMWDTGVEIRDGMTWTLEVGFRHLSGVAPMCQYEAVIYVGWQAR